MSEVILFSGAEALNTIDARSCMIRIPEVSLRLRQVQGIFDQLGKSSPLLLNYLLIEDEWFARESELKNLISSVVQLGLLDRYKKSNPNVEFFIGVSGASSVLPIATGEQDLTDWIANHPWMLKSESVAVAIVPDCASEEAQLAEGNQEDSLGGMFLARGFAQVDLDLIRVQKSTEVGMPNKIEKIMRGSDISKMIRTLKDQFQVDQIVNIGPGQYLSDRLQNSVVRDTVRVTNSIELDPLLTWLVAAKRESGSAYFRN